MKKRIYTLCFLLTFVSCIVVVLPFLFCDTVYALCISPFLAVILALVSGKICASASLKRLESTDPDEVDDDDCDGELKPFFRKIIRQNGLINSQMYELKRRMQEFNAITENMAEGLVVADSTGKLLIVNSHAKNILSASSNSVFELSENGTFLSAVKNALSGKSQANYFDLNGRIYRIYADPLKNENKLTGCVILLADITEQEERETMRREFTSNVSHELKTPLTSIYGISEILAGGIVRTEDIPRFAKSIHDETGRMITLVNDIIKLSQLDENSIEEVRSLVDLKAICEKVVMRLTPVAEQKNISLSVTGNCGNVMGISGIIEEMIYNLTDNGIKYNSDGGFVKISLSSDENGEKISVTDNGIGIAPQHVPRIFERFYRVDKSHSKQVGGTGLGLSIVKHGANFHKAKIDVKSTVDKGSEISLVFQKI